MFTDSHHALSLVSESQQCSTDSHEACFHSSRSIISPIGCGPSYEEITVRLLETYVTGRRSVERYHHIHGAVYNTLFKVQWLVLYCLSSRPRYVTILGGARRAST